MRLTEQHFTDLADAAWLAKDHGSAELAERLDIMARKANLECTRIACPTVPGTASLESRLKWQDMPSVFDLPEGC